MLTILTTWSEQVFILTAAAALAAVTLTHPRARLRMWQGLLALLLLLPMIEPWKTPPEQVESVTVEMGAVTIVQTASVPRWHWRAEDWLWVLAAGAALQLLWIGAGFLRLRLYRRQARGSTRRSRSPRGVSAGTPAIRFPAP